MAFVKKQNPDVYWHLGVSKNKGTPKWMGLQWKTLLKWMIWGKPTIFGNIHLQPQDAIVTIRITTFFLGSEGDLYTPSSHRIPRCTASKLTDFSPLKIACPQKSKDRRTKSHPLFNQVRFFQESPDLFPEYIFWETIRPQMVLLWTRILVSETPVFFCGVVFFRTKSEAKSWVLVG